ncbi:hypothetical protein DFJ73DRAFT_940386 [Zopfochytrium polystomum]|nr:hypothetical protein DFJ73DRAFT_940386 [Zopfochytrium polystomum]
MKLSTLAIFSLVSIFLSTVYAAPLAPVDESDTFDVAGGKIQPPVAKKEIQPPAAKKETQSPSTNKKELEVQPPVAKKQATDTAATASDDDNGEADAAGLGYGGLYGGYGGYGLGYGKKFGRFGGYGKKFGGSGINVKNVEIENKDFGDDFGRDWNHRLPLLAKSNKEVRPIRHLELAQLSRLLVAACSLRSDWEQLRPGLVQLNDGTPVASKILTSAPVAKSSLIMSQCPLAHARWSGTSCVMLGSCQILTDKELSVPEFMGEAIAASARNLRCRPTTGGLSEYCRNDSAPSAPARDACGHWFLVG